MMVQRPTITGIVAWSNERFVEHRLGLFALALVAAIVPVARHARFDGLTAIGQEFVLLLCTAAMALLVLRPKGARAIDAAGEVLGDAPRLVMVKIATSALGRFVPFLLAFAAFGPRNGTLVIIIWLLAIPLAFVCQLAFVSAVIERTGPVEALADAFRRARVSGLPIVAGLSILFAVIERAPSAIFTFIANTVFPPADVPTSFPHFPDMGIPFPAFPAVMLPGRYGSAIPWFANAIITIANVPFFAYLTVLYTGAALSFADTDPVMLEPEHLDAAPHGEPA